MRFFKTLKTHMRKLYHCLFALALVCSCFFSSGCNKRDSSSSASSQDSVAAKPKAAVENQIRQQSRNCSYNIVYPDTFTRQMRYVMVDCVKAFIGRMQEGDRVSIFEMGYYGFTNICKNVRKNELNESIIARFDVGLLGDRPPKLYDSLADLVLERNGSDEVIIVVSDEAKSLSDISSDDFLAMIKSAGVPIYTIGIRAPQAAASEPGLKEISSATGGQHYFKSSTKELPEVFVQVLNDSKKR